MKGDPFSGDVQEFLRLLDQYGVRYLLVGGAAVIYHGHARMTGDVDFLYDSSAENCERLWGALKTFWGGSVPSVGDASELTDPALILQFGRPPNRIDLIAKLDAVPFADAWDRRVQESIQVSGKPVPVWIISLPDLRAAKLRAGRPKDLDDLAHLRQP